MLSVYRLSAAFKIRSGYILINPVEPVKYIHFGKNFLTLLEKKFE